MLYRWLLLLSVVLFSAAEDVVTDNVEESVEESGEVEKKPFDTFTEDERASISASQETHEFQAEVTRLMDILINSLYSNREIFLRELISNAADALDKVRFLSLTQEGLLQEGEDLGIKLSFDPEVKTITITDQGIGMTKDDLIKNLGIVAKSGTSDFLDASSKSDNSMNLIGQFGVGFYSVYLVANKVTVISKHPEDDQYIWESSADSKFTISKDPRGNTLGRGTSIVLHLKEEAEEFMNEGTLSGLVDRYSQFIDFPISLKTTKTVEHEVEMTPEEIEAEKTDSDEEESTEDDGEEDEPKMKTVSEEIEEWKVLNDAKPLWTRSPKDISEEEYNEFYKTLTKDTTEPMDKLHFLAEGEITFRSILYVPKTAESGMYDRYYEKSNGLKLYVRRVLISDEFDDFLPRYMNFVKGIVDSDDLPLTVSRETLAQSRVLKVMSKKLIRKVLELLRKMAEKAEEEDADEGEEAKELDTTYNDFWSQYGKSIKLGVMEDKKNKAKLTKLLRYTTSKSNGELTSLERYVDRMPEEQEAIYFITCQDTASCKAHPALEKFAKKGIEVLYFDDSLDEYVAQNLHEFDNLDVKNILRESAQLPESSTFKEVSTSEEMTELVSYLTTTLGSAVNKVIVSNKLTTSPVVCTVPEYGWTGNMERIMRAQAISNDKEINAQVPKKILEINPFHPIIKEMASRRKADAEDPLLKDTAFLLLESAKVSSGFIMDEPEAFAKRIHKLVFDGLKLDSDAPMIEENYDASEEDDEEEEEEAEDVVDVEEE